LEVDRVEHFPSRSRSETDMMRELASISTWPKNWRPSAGEVLGADGAAANRVSGPNVASNAFGPNAPALSGPETNPRMA
jgi:hypothetical protein